ncbi:peroxide stress protein YaaA [Marinospirillum alkaliphilum]|uniref:UPF0246 protein SAMN02745752_01086 n=1 Tax=Marinospirillum alkaliphilum DSM 21637 TaxID=1122209 RepID=A0A1K1VV98_9GAMM|nr:peroxide stress protein YaaA [Marinospirillum alkaliphilum]SFX29016.1 hypothetical protein SAMN02745752_01086 [Marinospirillum alkaliphilum DSM 21637]
MLSLLSPAKSIDFETPASSNIHSQPLFLEQAAELVEQLRPLAPQDLCQLMKISDKLGTLNAGRYQQWHQPFTPANAKPAAQAFTGDVYTGLDAPTLNDKALNFGQRHLRILSGLYGLLKPMDLIQPYRLEMGTGFANHRGKDLYAFWQPLLADQINRELAEHQHPVLVNLASQEYFKAVDTSKLQSPVVTPVFKDWKNGQYKIISFYAKKARGLMARFILEQRIDQPEGIKDFSLAGYSFDPAQSKQNTWVFTRREST